MSDTFHKDVPVKFIKQMFQTMKGTPHLTYQVLTKRAERLLELSDELEWPENVWMGVTVESANYLNRIDNLRKTGANVKFLSCEPLLGALPDLDLNGIDWVIVGGEKAPRPRQMEADWARDIRDQCLKAKVPFFFKQWSGRSKKDATDILDGKKWHQFP